MERNTVTTRIRCGLSSPLQITVENSDRGSLTRISKRALAADAITTAG
jgi:hypothetical protein